MMYDFLKHRPNVHCVDSPQITKDLGISYVPYTILVATDNIQM